MKRNRVKFLIILVLCLVFVLSINAVYAMAEEENSQDEQEEITQPEVTEEVVDNDLEKDKDGIVDKVLEGVKDITSKENYFNQNILPILLGNGTSLLTILGLLIPYLRKNEKFKQLQGLYTRAIEEIENQKNYISSTDVDTLRNNLKDIVGENVLKAINELKLDKLTYAEIKASIDSISANIDSIKMGAMNAWQSSKEAVACLSANSSENVIRKKELENQKLKDYIREQKGDEAESIINELVG